LGSFFPAPGFCSEELHLFVATGLVTVEGPRRAADPDEEITSVRVSLGDAAQLCFQDAKSYMALARLKLDLRTGSS
jgi:hypothetical protein